MAANREAGKSSQTHTGGQEPIPTGGQEPIPTWFRTLHTNQQLMQKGRGKSRHRGPGQNEMEQRKYCEVARTKKELRQQVAQLLEQHAHAHHLESVKVRQEF